MITIMMMIMIMMVTMAAAAIMIIVYSWEDSFRNEKNRQNNFWLAKIWAYPKPHQV